MNTENKTRSEITQSEITDEQIEGLRGAAGQAGDLDMVAICDRALDGDDDARAECGRCL